MKDVKSLIRVVLSIIDRIVTKEIGKNNKRNRDRWLRDIIKLIPDGSRILDAGAGELQYKKICDHLNYVSQDFCEYDGEGDSKGLQTQSWNQKKTDIICDITSIPEKDSSFDAIMCIEVLEHVKNPEKVIEEFNRVLKIGGKLILTAPFCSITHFSPFYYITGLSVYWYEHHLEINNFKINHIKKNGNYYEYLSQEIRRLSQISIKYSKSNTIHRIIIMGLSLPFLFLLYILSKKDRGSNELLCFGHHVFAEKIKNRGEIEE